MEIHHMTTDQVVFWEWKSVKLSYTIVVTWAVMAFMGIASFFITRRLATEPPISRLQNLLETIVLGIRNEIEGIGGEKAAQHMPFVATLFLFIAVSNLIGVLPGVYSPTASLSTTTALAACVFVYVPLTGIRKMGVIGYLKNYIKPSPIMLPLNIIGEITRTVALAVRLFGNIMSGTKLVAIFVSLAPFVFPIFFNLLGLLTGLIQAYIFALLATVYIASAIQTQEKKV
jgi:F-type H+-transporting ATPase subunit a